MWCGQEELVGGNVTKLMPSDTAAKHAHYMERYLKTGDARVVGKKREVRHVLGLAHKAMRSLSV